MSGWVAIDLPFFVIMVYYESIKRDLKIQPIPECRCDERLKTKSGESTRLTYTSTLGSCSVREKKNLVSVPK